MLTFTDLLDHLELTWRDQSRRTRIFAVRYYRGIDTLDDLRRYLDSASIAFIVRMR
jgi:hypothetical protein